MTAVQILLHCTALRLLQEMMVKTGRVPVQVQKPLTAAAGFPVAFLLGDLHAGALGKEADCVGIGEVLDIHDKVDGAAALFAAEAVVDLLVRRDGKGPGLLTVKGAETE